MSAATLSADASAGGRRNLLGLTRAELGAFVHELGEKPFRAQQLTQWMYQYGVDDFDAMTNLSKALRARLKETAVIAPPTVRQDQLAPDGTRKWLIEVDAKNCIETVFIPEGGRGELIGDHAETDDPLVAAEAPGARRRYRGTLCISSQVGCTLACAFCATGHQGFNRNLSSAEIVSQLWLANRLLDGAAHSPEARAITNVVFMGMGEPLLNFEAVTAAMDVMLDDRAYGLSRRRVTLSTAGLVPLIDRLRERCPVSLAVSLHAPSDRLRDELVPLNRKYPIAELLAACRRYVAGDTRRRVTFEYVMLEGVNDGLEHAKALVALLRDVPAKVNLIPFNPFPDTRFKRSSQSKIDRFRELLLQAGLVTITRKTRGAPIDAACGQLAGRVTDRTRRGARGEARSR